MRVLAFTLVRLAPNGLSRQLPPNSQSELRQTVEKVSTFACNRPNVISSWAGHNSDRPLRFAYGGALGMSPVIARRSALVVMRVFVSRCLLLRACGLAKGDNALCSASFLQRDLTVTEFCHQQSGPEHMRESLIGKIIRAGFLRKENRP